MNTATILRLLQNSGFNVLGVDGSYIYLEDPSCILRSFETFAEYAWIIIFAITAFLLTGWAISMIRGAKNDIFINLRNLVLIFGTLSAAIPIINFIWGDDLFARGCDTITVSIENVNKVLDARKLQLSKRDEYNLYEEFDIYDSGAEYYTDPRPAHEIPYADAPLMASGDADEINAIMESDTGPDNAPTQTPNAVIKPDNAPKTNADKSESNPPARGASFGAARPQHAKSMSKDVIYTNPDGTQHRRTGGSRAWRNNNPGNIRYSEFSRRAGAIGSAGGFAVFPDEETGMAAIDALLRSDSYNKLTVAGAISRYAPPTENNTAAYHRQIEKMTGLSINKRMSDLTDAEMARVTNAIRTIEGWSVGRTVQM